MNWPYASYSIQRPIFRPERQDLNRQICSFHQQKSQRADCDRRTEKCLIMWTSLSVHECVSAGGQSATSRASKWPQIVCPLKAMAFIVLFKMFPLSLPAM